MGPVPVVAVGVLGPPARLLAALGVPALGAVPHLRAKAGIADNVFPNDSMDLDSFTHADIILLSAFYNEDFRIVAGDGLLERRNKVKSWIRE